MTFFGVIFFFYNHERLIPMVNVGKIIPYMDPMGTEHDHP